jgi:hypothetical protein
MTGGTPCLTPNSNDPFITVWFTTCTSTYHNSYRWITWVPNPPSPNQPLNWLGYDGCAQDPINSLTNGWVKINQISVKFDISEDTALIGDYVDVTVKCINNYDFDQFVHSHISFNNTMLEPAWPYVIETARTNGHITDTANTGSEISVSGSRPGGFGLSSIDGEAFYKLRFRVISTAENVLSAISWHYDNLHTRGVACQQDLNALYYNAVLYLAGSFKVPAYAAVVDFGDASGSNQSSCDEIKVPIILTNNYRVNGLELVIDYGDYDDPNLDAIDVVSTDPLGHPLNFTYQICPAGKYAIVNSVGYPTYDVSATPDTIGSLILRYASSSLTPTYTVQLVNTDCAPYNDASQLATNDEIRDWTLYTLGSPQFTGTSGTVTIDPPLAVAVVSSATARWHKTTGGGYYDSYA